MKIYIELVFMFILAFIYFGWKIWFKRSNKKLLKEYSPEKDMSSKIHHDKNYKGGVFETGRNEGTDKGTDAIPFNPVGSKQSEGRGLLQKADVGIAGKDCISNGESSNSTRKNRSSIRRRLFGRKHKEK